MCEMLSSEGPHASVVLRTPWALEVTERTKQVYGFFFCVCLFLFLRWRFALVAQAGVQWHNLGSLQPPPPLGIIIQHEIWMGQRAKPYLVIIIYLTDPLLMDIGLFPIFCYCK